jgi:hypothetical protein
MYETTERSWEICCSKVPKLVLKRGHESVAQGGPRFRSGCPISTVLLAKRDGETVEL